MPAYLTHSLGAIMKLKMPTPIEEYVKASNESNLEVFLSCFAEDATVLDEGETITGLDAITKWFIKTRSKYQFKSLPLAIKDKKEAIILTAEVSGNFPGSPVILDYHIKISSGLIQDLKIC